MSAQLKPRHFLAAAIVSSLCVLPAYAQYVGPSSGTAQGGSVGAIVKSPIDDQQVTLQGHLLRKIGHEKYEFSDGTGEIVVEIDDKIFPNQRVDEKTIVEIAGEVDTGLHRPAEIEVDAIRIVK